MFTLSAKAMGIGDWVAKVHERTHRHRYSVIVPLVLVITLLAGWSALRGRYAQELFDALPNDPALGRYRALLNASGEGSRIVVGFRSANGTPMDDLTASADGFVEAMIARSELVESVFFRPDLAIAEQVVAEIYARLPLYADSALLQQFTTLDSAAVDRTVAAIRASLDQPGAELQLDGSLRDPFALCAPLIARLQSRGTKGMSLIDGRLFTADSTMAIVVLMPSVGGRASPEELMEVVNAALADVGTADVHGAAFGVAPMAVANAQRIASDSWATSIAALVLVLALLLWYYRSLRVPLLFLVAPLFGFLLGLGAIAAVRPTVSLLSLGASAALLGIALDYGFHFFTHLRHCGSIQRSLKEVSAPLLLGCVTTVLAFASLSFVGSRALADLGFIAALMLVGAACMVLFVIPHFARAPERAGEALPTSPRRKHSPWPILATVVISVVLLPFIGRVTYDDDPEHVSWIAPDMKAVRDKLEGDMDRAVPVLLAASGADEEHARRMLERSVAVVRAHAPGEYDALLPTDLRPSERTSDRQWTAWQSMSNARADELRRWFAQAAKRHGFVAGAFEPFLDHLRAERMDPPSPLLNSIAGEMLAHDGTRTIIAGRMSVPSAAIASLEHDLATEPAIEVLHRGVLGARMQRMVGEDLAGILWRTSLIVFLALLITYGRIELALLTFLPMALGWAWILGICGLFGIPFNLVNILVCTFIFGLGDDYCIFTSEGLLARYRTGADHTRSFRGAVVLSAITTIIGTGVLVFAQHPALRSIAQLSVVGMLALLAISLTVQPVLFRLFISGRAVSGRQPFTLFSFALSSFAFLYFLLGCLVLSVLWIVLIALPFPVRRKRHVLRSMVRVLTGSLVYVMANTRKDIQGYRAAITGRPAIIIANHASFIDILAMLMITPNVVMMTNRWVWNSPFFGRVVRYAGYLRTEDGTEVNIRRTREAMEQGLSLIVFPEGTRSRDGGIGRFHKGAFHIAEALQVPIVPVLLHGFGEAMGKHDALLKNSLLTMRTLPAIEPGDQRFGTGDRERTKRIAEWFRQEYEHLRRDRETPRRFRERLVRNFTYKGPVLEWHTRVKARMDEDLHELIHARIPQDARVADLGSGHGMVAYLLAWSAPRRTVIGLERDPEKTAIAMHCFSRTDRITFQVADLEHADPPPADAYVLKDVLHYLAPATQRELLLRCANKLTGSGAIFVRDGFDGGDQRHERTRLTERISTGIGFNKAEHGLCFMTREQLLAIAREAGLRVEWALARKGSSNELAILTRA